MEVVTGTPKSSLKRRSSDEPGPETAAREDLDRIGGLHPFMAAGATDDLVMVLDDLVTLPRMKRCPGLAPRGFDEAGAFGLVLKSLEGGFELV